MTKLLLTGIADYECEKIVSVLLNNEETILDFVENNDPVVCIELLLYTYFIADRFYAFPDMVTIVSQSWRLLLLLLLLFSRRPYMRPAVAIKHGGKYAAFAVFSAAGVNEV